MNWMTLKKEVESKIQEAGITNKQAIKTILKLERRVNTMRNKIYNYDHSWEAVCSSNAYYDAEDALELLYGDYTPAPYQAEWLAYCEANETSPRANVGDKLA